MISSMIHCWFKEKSILVACLDVFENKGIIKVLQNKGKWVEVKVWHKEIFRKSNGTLLRNLLCYFPVDNHQQ